MDNKEKTSVRAGVIEPQEKENTIKVTKAKAIILEEVIQKGKETDIDEK